MGIVVKGLKLANNTTVSGKPLKIVVLGTKAGELQFKDVELQARPKAYFINNKPFAPINNREEKMLFNLPAMPP